MGFLKETYTCIHCGVEKRKQSSTNGIYCSNKCQAAHKQIQSDKLFSQGLNGIYTENRAIRKAMARIKGYKCEVCGISEWNGKEIVLEIEHIDGKSNNNKIDNLMLICPNCHSQTPTYKKRNNGKSTRVERRKKI